MLKMMIISQLINPELTVCHQAIKKQTNFKVAFLLHFAFLVFKGAFSLESKGRGVEKAPSELVEMLSPLQQQQGSGHGSKHPSCPKLAAK